MKNERNIMFTLIGLIVKYSRPVLAVLLLCVGFYVVYSALYGDFKTNDLKAWLKGNGDAQLLEHYARIQDVNRRNAFGAACKVYEKRYGKVAWLEHFRKQNLDLNAVTYEDLAEIAMGMSTAEDRDAFLETHAAAYDACVKNGMLGEARAYANLLKEVHTKGGRDWDVVSRNPFSVAVYSAVKQNPKLWEWYLDNHNWCDSFLVTCNPGEGAGLDKVLEFLSAHRDLLQQLDKEISSLNAEELRELASLSVSDGKRQNCGGEGDKGESLEALYASCLVLSGEFSTVLESVRKINPQIPLLETVAVLANNHDAFDLNTTNDCRHAGEELIRLHDQHPILWEHATEDMGQKVIKFWRDMPQFCDQIVGEFGAAHVVEFLYTNFCASATQLRVASEILYKCKESGWAVLVRFADNEQFKAMLENPKIGFRIVPYYLKRRDEIFSKVLEDPRYVDELLDKDGNLKKQDVKLVETLPFVGDTATVIRKWCENRPIEMSEIVWVAFDVVDTALMVCSLGGTKVATTGGKVVAKTTATRIGRRPIRKVGIGMAGKIPMRRVTTGTLVKVAVRQGGMRKGLSFWKRTSQFFKNTTNSIGGKAKNAWKTMKNLPPETKIKIYRSAKMAGFIKWGCHTLPDKGPAFIRGLEEDIGETVGKFAHAVVAGAGDGFKAAVREVLGTTPDQFKRIAFTVVGGCLVLGALLLMCGKRSMRERAVVA